MYADRDAAGRIGIHDLTTEEAELLQTAVLRLSESAEIKNHARLLRRLAIELDKQINIKKHKS